MARIFIADGREHPDPNPNLTIEKVRDLMADFLPDLTGATWTETARGVDTLIEFNRRVGTKEASQHKFPMGRVVMTRNLKERAEAAVGEAVTAIKLAEIIQRHGVGDWGDLSPEDEAENELSLEQGFRLMSAYSDVFDFKVWVITEADRSVTTILLPEDY